VIRLKLDLDTRNGSAFFDHYNNTTDTTSSIHDNPNKDDDPALNSGNENVYGRYASCDMKWHGLTLLDYALLAEAAYFDPSQTNLTALLSYFFPPHQHNTNGTITEHPTFQVAHCPFVLKLTCN
jgi:hypothetical protein